MPRHAIEANQPHRNRCDATAAALIGALETRFAGGDVALRMGGVQGERASLRDIALHGNAQIRLGQDAAWLPTSFEALYDTDTQSVLSPSIALEGTGVAGTKTAALPLPGLQAQVVEAMASAFASQRVDVSLQDARVVCNDGRRLVVRAQGIAPRPPRSRCARCTSRAAGAGQMRSTISTWSAAESVRMSRRRRDVGG